MPTATTKFLLTKLKPNPHHTIIKFHKTSQMYNFTITSLYLLLKNKSYKN